MRTISAILVSFSLASCSAFSSLSKTTMNKHVMQQQYHRHETSNTQLPAFRFGNAAESIAEEKSMELDQTNLQISALQSKIFDPATDILITTLRIGTCALMIHHGIDKVDNVEGFSANVVSKFFGFLPGQPQFWTLSAAFTQIGGSALLAVGILARPVALSMCATMVTAVVFHLLNTGPEGFPLAVVPQHSYNYELAAMYVAVLAYFSVAGAGAYSVDELVLGGELNLYETLVSKITGKEEEEIDAVVEEPVSNQFFPWSK